TSAIESNSLIGLSYRSHVRRVAAPFVALLALAPAAHAAQLRVLPKSYSPQVGVLTIEGQLASPRRVGVRIVNIGGRALGWIDTPSVRTAQTISTETLHLRAGRQAIVWAPPASTPPRTYLLGLTATDAAGNSRTYGAETAYVRRYLPAPVVRVLGIDAAFGQPSYAPGQLAVISIATDAPSFTFQVFRVGGELVPTYLDSEMSGLPVTQVQRISWLLHRDGPRSIRLHVGAWRTGLYYAELRAPDGRVGYAPFVVRPSLLGFQSRVAVVMPTNTWQAY